MPTKVPDELYQKQRKITDSWFLKLSKVKENVQTESKSPEKQSLKRKASEPVESLEEKDGSDDDEIVKSSQSTSESNLRKKINKTMLTSKLTPCKDRLMSPESVIDKLSISEREINDIYDDIVDKEPIEMTHDVSDLIASDKLPSNVLEYSPVNNQTNKMEASGNDSGEDNLVIDEDTENKCETSRGIGKRIKTRKIFSLKKFDQSVTNEKGKKTKSHQVSAAEKFEKKKRGRPRKTTVSDKVVESIKKSSELSARQKKREIPKKNAVSEVDFENDETSEEDSDESYERCELSEAQLEKLKNLKIDLQHEVPPQHQISTRIRPFTKAQTVEFEKYGPMKQGPYSEKEDKIIRKNWKNFCEIHKWDVKDVKPFLAMRWNRKIYFSSNEERCRFLQFLANGLPWRNVVSVYNRFKNLYDTDIKTGLFSKEEDEIIASYLAKTSANKMAINYDVLAKKLNRKKRSVHTHVLAKFLTSTKSNKEPINKKQSSSKEENYKTMSNMKSDQVEKKDSVHVDVEWTYPVVRKFLDTLLHVTSCTNVDELKDKEFNQQTWIKAEKEMSIHESTLKNFWYTQLHMQLFCPKPIYLNDLKIDIIKYLYEEKQEDIENLDWETVCLDFDGTTPLFFSKLFDHLVKFTQEKINSYDIKKIIDYLYNNYIPELKNRKTDAVLPKVDSKLRSMYRISENRIACVKLNSPLDHDDLYAKFK